MSKLFHRPSFLVHDVPQEAYTRWLHRKANTHVRRDRLRKSYLIMGSEYRRLIHAAVCASEGKDHYTGETLRWDLLSTFSNDAAANGGSIYKAGFALLPTVDHIPSADYRYDFVICGWRTNNAKSDLTHDEFLTLCSRVLAHFNSKV